MNIEDKRDFLDELSDYEGTELGDFWRSLCHIHRYEYCTRSEFTEQVGKEIEKQFEEAIDLVKTDEYNRFDLPDDLMKIITEH